MTVESEIADALAGIEYLNHLENIDASNISVMGLSLGGIVTTATAGKSVKTGHVFDCDKGEDTVNAVIEKSVNFIKAHSEVN